MIFQGWAMRVPVSSLAEAVFRDDDQRSNAELERVDDLPDTAPFRIDNKSAQA
jgi:hypothetical protein